MVAESADETVDGALRRYEPGDRDAVVSLHRTALREAGTNPEDVPDNDDLRDVESTYLDTGGAFLVVDGAQTDGQADAIVAMGGLAVEGDGIPSGAGELLRIAVHPDHQRAGYGSAIVAGLEEAARDRGLDRVFLWTAQRQRSAVRFYRSRGYQGTDHRTEGEYELLRYEKSLD